MSEPAKKASKRPPNPKCGNCSHPYSFHPRNVTSHRRKCGAFGCHCKNFKKAEDPVT